VPATIADALRGGSERILGGQASREFQMWAVHPGGRSVLDAVEDAFELDEAALTASRNVLQEYGNMSSPTILFVLEALMREKPARGSQGCAMAFGPGLTAADYIKLPSAAHWILAAGMIVGRLEVIMAVVLFLPGYWRR